jgi:Fe2+ or Zn2+ uptake regulation protein
MLIKLDFEEENIEKIANRYKVLGNPNNLLILLTLQEEPFTLDGVHDKIKKKGYLHRESTYRALEKLVKADFLKKEYDQSTKKIYYILKQKNE